MSRLVFLTKVLTHYRAGFHERVRTRLAENNVAYDLVYGQMSRADEASADSLTLLGWAKPIRNLYIVTDWSGSLRLYATVTDFELIVVGSGSDAPIIAKAAESRRWLKALGPRFGKEKAELLQLAHLFLMPGPIGLPVLDAGISGLPVVTTAYPWHSPKIAYLEPGVNGMVTRDWQSASSYARDIVSLFQDPDRMTSMATDARRIAERYTIDNMADRFAAGALKALNTAKL